MARNLSIMIGPACSFSTVLPAHTQPSKQPSHNRVNSENEFLKAPSHGLMHSASAPDCSEQRIINEPKYNDPNRLASKLSIERYIEKLNSKLFTLGHVAKCLQIAPKLYPSLIDKAFQVLPNDSLERQQLQEFIKLQTMLNLRKDQAVALVKSFSHETNPKAGNLALLDCFYRRPLQKGQRKDFLAKIIDHTLSAETKAIYKKLILNQLLTLRRPIEGESIKNEILYDQQSGYFYAISAFKSNTRNNSQIKQKLTYHLTLDPKGHILGFFHTVDLKPSKTEAMQAPQHGAIEKITGTYFHPFQEIPAGTSYVTIKNGVKLPGLDTAPPFRVISSSNGLPFAVSQLMNSNQVELYPYELPQTNDFSNSQAPVPGHLYPDGSFDIRKEGKNINEDSEESEGIPL